MVTFQGGRDTNPPPNHDKARQKLWELCPDAQHAVEVGVWLPAFCHVSKFIDAGVRVQLVEPQPEVAKELDKKWGHLDNVTIHRVAVAAEAGEVTMFRPHPLPTAHLQGSDPPSKHEGRDGVHRITVPAITFDTIDDGTIDVLSCDTEGSDWHVISKLKSRPTVIAVEMHHSRWRNKHHDEIIRWMEDNSYLNYGVIGGDDIYVKA